MASCPRMYIQRDYRGNSLRLMAAAHTATVARGLTGTSAIFPVRVIKWQEAIENTSLDKGSKGQGFWAFQVLC